MSTDAQTTHTDAEEQHFLSQDFYHQNLKHIHLYDKKCAVHKS